MTFSPIRFHLLVAAAALVVLFTVTCSDDAPSHSVTGPDQTPPAIASITPVDQYHIDVRFSESVTASSAENGGNYLITKTGTLPPAKTADAYLPGDTLTLASLVLRSGGNTVTITTDESMANFSYSLSVNYIVDLSGNSMTTESVKPFNGSRHADVTPPVLASRSPAPGATGVPIGAPISMKFSEPVLYGPVVAGTTLRDNTGKVLDCGFNGEYPPTFTLTPRDPLHLNETYTVTVNASDLSANAMSPVQWSFTTANTVDTTPATLISTFPPNLAVNVDVFSTFSMVFSDSMQEDEMTVEIAPNPGEFSMQWSPSGKSVMLRFDQPLLDDQQYLVTIYADGSTDFSGNELADMYTVLFTTGSALGQGSFSGTIAGDPGTAAADPAGAVVLAASGSLLSGAIEILGGAVVGANGAYTISNLPDGVYFPVVFKDATGDGFLLDAGDALGGYGLSLKAGDFEPDSVMISGGTPVSGVDFPLSDGSGIRGTLTYGGVYASDYLSTYVGIFDTNGFDLTSIPLAVTHRFWPFSISWTFNALIRGIPDGDYYLGAFFDLDGSHTFDLGSEPVGVYGGVATPTVVHIENGSDVFGIVIPIEDPTNPGYSATIAWPRETHHTRFERLLEAAQKSAMVAKK